jgi:hypothetical protein
MKKGNEQNSAAIYLPHKTCPFPQFFRLVVSSKLPKFHIIKTKNCQGKVIKPFPDDLKPQFEKNEDLSCG